MHTPAAVQCFGMQQAIITVVWQAGRQAGKRLCIECCIGQSLSLSLSESELSNGVDDAMRSLE